MSKKVRISVVIAAYNEAKYIKTVLTALASQTIKDFELIVVDNNSSDATSSIARQMGAKVFLEKNQGYVFAVERGLREATGDILAVTDSDTSPDSDWLEKILHAFEDKSVVAVTGSVKYKDAGFWGNLLTYPIYTLFLWANFFVGKPHMTGTSLAMRKEVYLKAGGLDTRYKISADVEIGLRLKKYGKVVFLPTLSVVASSRRWSTQKSNNFLKYTKAYFETVWFGKPPLEDLKPVR